MKTCLRALACVVLGCLLSACPETTVNDDFGLKPVQVDADDWSGTWMPIDDDDTFHFAITDAAQGALRLIEPGKKDDKPLEFKLHHASPDDDVKLWFALVREGAEKEAKTQAFLLRRPEKGVTLWWMIDDVAVEKAIKAGQLKGTTKRVKDDPHNHLDSDPANYLKLLEPQFWNWSEPSILRRVK